MTAPATVAAGTKFTVSTFRHSEELPVEITSSASVDRGASAVIFKGTLKFPGKTPITVALKVFPILLREHEQEMLRRELRTSSKVSHKCVLPFIGTAVLGGRTIIVSPFMKNGNLLAYVRAKPRVDRRMLIKQVAEAVNFLHVHERVVHGDLKCENVLISDSGNALVSDFGLSTLIDKEESSATTMSAIRDRNTLRFAAPELLLDPEDSGRPRSKTRESDVYAFAMLLLQAFTGKMPWPELRNEAVLVKVVSRAQHARPGGDALQLGLSDKWWAVCLKCWKYGPRDRPSMLQVCNQLEEIRAAKSSLNSTNTTPTRIPAVPDPPIPQDTTNIISPTGLLGLPFPFPQDLFMRGPDVWNPYIPIPPSIPALPPYQYPIVSVINSPGYVSRERAASVVCVAYDSRTRRIIYATNDHSVHVVESSTGLSLISPLALHEGPIYALCLRPTSQRFFSCSEDHTIIEWSTVSSTSSSSLSCRKMRKHSGAVTCMALSTDGKTLVSGSLDCTLRFWDSETRDTIGSSLRSASGVLCVAFSPDSSTVASGSEDGTIRLWNVSTGTRVKIGSSTMGAISCLSFAPGGRRVISVSRPAQSVHVWSISGGEIVGQWQPKIGSPSCIAISPSGQRLAYQSSVGGELCVCDAQSGQLLCHYTCSGHCSSPVISFAPNNESLAVCYYNGSSPVLQIFEPMHHWGMTL